MMYIFRVLFSRYWQVSLFPQLSMSLNKPCITIRNYWVVNLWHFNLVPSSAEHKITLKYFVFKSCSKTTRLNSFFYCTLDSSSNSTNCFQLRSSKLSRFQVRIEHSFDESCIFVNFEWLTNQFEFFHNLKLGIDFNNYTGSTNSKVSLILNSRYSKKCCSHCIHGRVEYCKAESKLRCIFYHTHVYLRITCFIFHGEYGDRLEFTPADRQG